MELCDENNDTEKSKVPKIIIVSIILLTLLTIGIISLIIYLKGSITTINIDDKRNAELEQLLYIQQVEGKNEVFVPILKVAKYFGYEGFNGDYYIKSEDKSKCHVVSEYETAMFTLDSNILVKVTGDGECEYIELDKAVFEKDGDLYTSIDGLEKGFNLLFSSDQKLKNINIYSMQYLVAYYASVLKTEKYSTSFADQKAIFQNMLITEDANKKFGVVDITKGKNILENKYEEISYIPATTDFLVKSNNKYGIVTKEAKTKIRMAYDSIQLIDNEKELYLIKQNNAYGVIDSEGNAIINPEYSQIGIKVDTYTQNSIENGYILLEKVIPVRNTENLWGLFDINGKQITDFAYSGLGCNTSTVPNSYPVLLIPDHEVIIVQKDRTYNLISIQGEELIPNDVVDSIYLKTDVVTGENEFYMTYNGKTADIDEWLSMIGK